MLLTIVCLQNIPLCLTRFLNSNSHGTTTNFGMRFIQNMSYNLYNGRLDVRRSCSSNGWVNEDVSGQDTQCPQHMPDTSGIISAKDRSTCPWHYVRERNPAVYPSIVFQAVQNCHFCIEANDKECIPISLQVPIYVPGTNGTSGVWCEKYITVGFTCAFRRIAG